MTTDDNPNDPLIVAIHSLSDWSKWLISLNFGVATGCVLVLRGEAAEAVRPMLLFAVMLFSLSVLCSSLFIFLLSSQIEKVAETREIRFKRLGIVQLILFASGIVCLLAWVTKLSGVFS